MSTFRKALIILVSLVAAVYFGNASWWAASPAGQVRLIAHRGVHQTFSREGLTNETCTAVRIVVPTHGFLENTLPSMRAAFEAGADIVEFDVHPTTDGHLVVIHDWTLDCRTDGTGVTRSHDLAYLRALDVGHGYTADGGRTFPFRGKGVGMMPEIQEVFAAFPNGRFLVNYKSNEEQEADMLAAVLAEHPAWRPLVWGVYGGQRPTLRTKQLIGAVAAFAPRDMMKCLGQYLAVGWTGIVPNVCHNTTVMVPLNVAPFVWGWPNRFLRRMRDAGTDVILIGRYSPGDVGTTGIDTLEDLAEVPDTFTGYIWTNRIETIGPAARRRWPRGGIQ